MQGVIAALPNDFALAEELGKKGTTNGITFFNRKAEGKYITVLAPTSIEEKYYAIAQSIMLANVVVLSTARIDTIFGESLIAASLLSKPLLITDDTDASSLLKGMRDYKIVSRSSVLSLLPGFAQSAEGATKVEIDRAFPVKGVGDVLLGIVLSGEVKVHDTLMHTSGKQVAIRSIQAQDEDIESASKGVRVGLAIKGIGYEEFEKGDVLAEQQIKKIGEFEFDIAISDYAGIKVDELNGMRLLLVHNFSFAEAEISQTGRGLFARLKKPIPLANGDQFLLIREKSPRIFAKGIVTKQGSQ